jgi:hypothetical protein
MEDFVFCVGGDYNAMPMWVQYLSTSQLRGRGVMGEPKNTRERWKKDQSWYTKNGKKA